MAAPRAGDGCVTLKDVEKKHEWPMPTSWTTDIDEWTDWIKGDVRKAPESRAWHVEYYEHGSVNKKCSLSPGGITA